MKIEDFGLESMEVKGLRERYGIGDSRNIYTSEELIELSQRKIYYIRPYRDENVGNIRIEYNHVLGYVSKDTSTCIWIKDKDIKDDKHYWPIELIRNCTEIKKGIYHNKVDDIIYCTTDELEFCLIYEKEFVKKKLQEQIQELEEEILKLKNVDIVF